MKKLFVIALPLLFCMACGKDAATNATLELRLTKATNMGKIQF